MTTSEIIRESIPLNRSTAECDEGPELSMRPGLLVVRYDAEVEHGREWTTLRFEGAVALRVTPEPAVSQLMASAYSRVAIVENSAWLLSLRGKTGEGQLPDELNHFMVFFDHYGCVETIAKSCDVIEQ